MNYIKKNGLVYTEDMKTLVAIDSGSHEFTGRVPFGVRYIDDEVFADCLFETITLPDSIEQLGVCLFQNSRRLFKVKLPSGLKELSPYLFSGCTALQSVSMPTVLNSFPEGLFYGCSAMLEIPFRAGIKELPESVFEGCSSIKSLVIPETVTKIASRAAAGCTDLVTLVLSASLYELAPDAFEGCTSLRNIRISEDNKLFYVSDDDGCLYERTANGDVCRLKVAAIAKQTVSFFKDNVDDEDEPFFTDESFAEEDETFSAEVEADSDEMNGTEIGVAEEEKAIYGELEEVEPEAAEADVDELEEVAEYETENKENDIINNKGETVMSDQNNVDDMLADIMNDERARTEVQSNVAVDEKESQVLSNMMDVMNDKPAPAKDVKISEEELENLFASHEKQETDTFVKEEDVDSDEKEGKTKILINSASLSKVIECEPAGEPLTEPELFVIAEITVTNENGEESFTEKLEKCCLKFAQAQDLKKVVLLAGLPVDNEEFMQFYKHFISYKNVVLACDAPSPSKLSDYARKICELSRIDLSKDALTEQRKKISIKNDSLIKLVIQDLR
ncbi:MAG: leucine-rich repeat domain-containing protein [Treponema sp.]|nr:leucine-rich repeat domain-containing protein [Treponema sp.]